MIQKKQNLDSEKALAGLNTIANMILSNKDPNITTMQILNYLQSSLGTFGAVSLKIDEKSQCLVLDNFTKSKIVLNALRLVPFDVDDIKYPLSSTALISSCVREDRIVKSNRLADFFFPVIKARKLLDSIQAVLGLKFCLGVPVKVDNKVVGAFFVVSKREDLSDVEKQLLQLYANMSGIAVENHRNMDMLKHLYETEKETAAILTHELKTPIAIAYNSSAILGQTIEKYGNALKTEFVDKLKTQQLEIQESIIRMNMICNSIFSLTEVENNLSVENQKLDLSNSIGRMVYAYKNFSKKGVAFSYKEKIKEGIYYGPAVQFEQVISIILENAFKYTKKGYVKMYLNMTGKLMECTITDSGPGIPKNERQKIFDRFYRSDSTIKVGKGLGLGLYIATKIATKLGGKIDLMDNPDQRGSRFIIRFPVYTKSNK